MAQTKPSRSCQVSSREGPPPAMLITILCGLHPTTSGKPRIILIRIFSVICSPETAGAMNWEKALLPSPSSIVSSRKVRLARRSRTTQGGGPIQLELTSQIANGDGATVTASRTDDVVTSNRRIVHRASRSRQIDLAVVSELRQTVDNRTTADLRPTKLGRGIQGRAEHANQLVVARGNCARGQTS